MLYLVRHGQTEFNTQLRIQGNCDSPLTPQGMAEAEKLAQGLADIDFKQIYTSPLGRAVQTAKILKGGRDIDLSLLDGLKEMNFGRWEQKTKGDIPPEELENFMNFFKAPEKYRPLAGAQSYEDMFDRVRQVGQDLLAEAKDQDILVVSHGVWIKSFYCLFQDLGISQMWADPFIKNTSLTLVDAGQAKPRFIKVADTSYLEA